MMSRGGCGARAQLMVAEWNKSMSTKATLMKLITASMMAEAAISGWRTSADENYLDPCPGKIIVFEDFLLVWIWKSLPSLSTKALRLL
jgi:hypothetical protein